MAEDLEVRAAARDETVPIVPARRDVPVHRGRFALAYLALAVIAGVGVGMAVLLLDRPAEETRIWSAWRPTGSESTFDDQIAEYVGNRYRLPSNTPLVAVVPKEPSITFGDTDLAVSRVIIQNDPAGDRDGFRVVDVGDSLMYEMCGRGQQCSIAEGQPSEQRIQLLRREALELALYTFKYRDETDTVIVFVPPNLGEQDDPEDDTAVALLFERSLLKTALEQPLNRTLLLPNPPQGEEFDSRESLIVDRLTRDRLFLYQFQPVQAGGAVIFLARPTE